MFFNAKNTIPCMQKWVISKSARSMDSYLHVKLTTRSPSTQRTNRYAIENFALWLRKYHNTTPDKVIDEFRNEEIAFDMLQAWVNWLSTTHSEGKKTKHEIPSATTTAHYFHIVIRFLHYMGIKFHPTDVKQEINLPKVYEKEKHGIKLDEIKLILRKSSFQKEAMRLAQLSSSMRIGELIQPLLP